MKTIIQLITEHIKEINLTELEEIAAAQNDYFFFTLVMYWKDGSAVVAELKRRRDELEASEPPYITAPVRVYHD